MNELPTTQVIVLSPIQINRNGERAERADAAANRQLILQAAERLFAERGVENVCMAEIAEAAGVGKGTLYRRYANKAELCLALMDSQMQSFQDRLLGDFRRLTDRGVSYLEQLNHFFDELVDFTEIHSPLLVEVERAGLFGEGAPPSMPHFWQYMTIHALLRQAVRTGEIANDLDLEYIGEALLATLQVDVFRFQRTVRGFSTARIQNGLRDMVRLLAAA
jgi:AcrR family transcriptional regulator